MCKNSYKLGRIYCSVHNCVRAPGLGIKNNTLKISVVNVWDKVLNNHANMLILQTRAWKMAGKVSNRFWQILKTLQYVLGHGAFYALLGCLDCTRKSYMPPWRGKFGRPESTRLFGNIFILRLYYLSHFSWSKPGFSDFGNELLAKIVYRVHKVVINFLLNFHLKKPRRHVLMHNFETS